MDRILELLSNWNQLSDEEKTELNELTTPEALAELTADQLTEVEAKLVGIVDEIDADSAPSDHDLEAMSWIASSVMAVRERATALAEAEEAALAQAEELRKKIKGDPEPDGDPTEVKAEDGPEDPEETGGEEGGESDPAPASEPVESEPESKDEPVKEPVAAAAKTVVSKVAARRPASARPQPPSTRSVAPLLASAGVPGQAAGRNLDSAKALGEAFAGMLSTFNGRGDGMKLPVAHAQIEYPADARLGRDEQENARKIEAAVGTTVVTAAGGICAPPAPRYDLPQFGTDARPVRDSLARFGFDRGGAILPTIPTIFDVDEAVGLWTIADDVDAVDNTGTRKPCMRVTCDDGTTVRGYAVTQCLEVGNWDFRTWPERIQKFRDLVNTWQARYAESRLLTLMGEASTQVTTDGVLGTARDVLAKLDLVTAHMRNRWRLAPNTPLHFWAPENLRAQMRADLVREMPGSSDERLAVADATIDSFFAVRRVNVTWFLDGEAGQIAGLQADGELNGWDPTTVTYLAPEGSFLFLDGGTLDLGLFRDGDLIAANNFRIFSETFEGLAFYGHEAIRLAMTFCPNGTTSGTADLSCEDTATS